MNYEPIFEFISFPGSQADVTGEADEVLPLLCELVESAPDVRRKHGRPADDDVRRHGDPHDL